MLIYEINLKQKRDNLNVKCSIKVNSFIRSLPKSYFFPIFFYEIYKYV